MNRRNLLVLTGAAVAAGATTAPARAADSVSLAIPQKGSWDAMNPSLGTSLGLFKKEQLELQMAYTAGGPDTIQAVATGSADIGFAVGTTAAISAYAKGAPIRIVAAQFTGASDLFFYVKGDSPIASFTDLSGKSIGFTRIGSSTWTVEHALADQFHAQPNYVSTGEVSATLTQVMSGQIDAGWSDVPELLDQVAQKKIKMIARGSDAKSLAGQTIRVHIVNANFLRDRRDVAVRFFRAYAATVDYVYKNLDKTLAFYAQYSGVSLDQARLLKPYLTAKSAALYPVAGFDRSIQDAIEFKFINAPLSAEQQKGIFEILVPHG